jgi:hypothetical protein
MLAMMEGAKGIKFSTSKYEVGRPSFQQQGQEKKNGIATDE